VGISTLHSLTLHSFTLPLSSPLNFTPLITFFSPLPLYSALTPHSDSLTQVPLSLCTAPSFGTRSHSPPLTPHSHSHSHLLCTLYSVLTHSHSPRSTLLPLSAHCSVLIALHSLLTLSTHSLFLFSLPLTTLFSPLSSLHSALTPHPHAFTSSTFFMYCPFTRHSLARTPAHSARTLTPHSVLCTLTYLHAHSLTLTHTHPHSLALTHTHSHALTDTQAHTR
jgi:hypothetical protein